MMFRIRKALIASSIRNTAKLVNTAQGMFACMSVLEWGGDLARRMIAPSIKSAHGSKATDTEAQAQEVGGTIEH